MEKVETIVIHEMGGGSHRIVPEKEIIKFLESLKKCPFCYGSNLDGKKFYTSYIVTCEECGFKVSSRALYFAARIGAEEKGISVSDILREPIQELVQKYEKELEQKLINLTFHLRFTEAKLMLHRTRFDR